MRGRSGEEGGTTPFLMVVVAAGGGDGGAVPSGGNSKESSFFHWAIVPSVFHSSIPTISLSCFISEGFLTSCAMRSVISSLLPAGLS